MYGPPAPKLAASCGKGPQWAGHAPGAAPAPAALPPVPATGYEQFGAAFYNAGGPDLAVIGSGGTAAAGVVATGLNAFPSFAGFGGGAKAMLAAATIAIATAGGPTAPSAAMLPSPGPSLIAAPDATGNPNAGTGTGHGTPAAATPDATPTAGSPGPTGPEAGPGLAEGPALMPSPTPEFTAPGSTPVTSPGSDIPSQPIGSTPVTDVPEPASMAVLAAAAAATLWSRRPTCMRRHLGATATPR